MQELVKFVLFGHTKRIFGGDFRVRFLIDTGDGFRERVNELSDPKRISVDLNELMNK